jgi:hypothetical protein
MMKKSLLLTLFLLAGGASAGEVYKCLQDGELTISDWPLSCPPSAVSKVVPVKMPSQASRSSEEELAHLKQRADTMERERRAHVPQILVLGSSAQPNAADTEWSPVRSVVYDDWPGYTRWGGWGRWRHHEDHATRDNHDFTWEKSVPSSGSVVVKGASGSGVTTRVGKQIPDTRYRQGR